MKSKYFMQNAFFPVFIILFLFCFSFLSAQDAAFSKNSDDLRVNPLQLISFKEVLNISKTMGSEFYPGLDYSKIPMLIYRPNVQELLFNYPHKPKGYSDYSGFNPLTNNTIYVRNDTTLFIS